MPYKVTMTLIRITILLTRVIIILIAKLCLNPAKFLTIIIEDPNEFLTAHNTIDEFTYFSQRGSTIQSFDAKGISRSDTLNTEYKKMGYYLTGHNINILC